jgi:hypothetical protein
MRAPAAAGADLCVCMCVYTYTHTHKHTHTYVCVCTHKHTHTYTHTKYPGLPHEGHTHTHTHTHKYTRTKHPGLLLHEMKKLLPKDPEAVEIIRGAQRANEVDNLIQRKKKKEKTFLAVHSAPMNLITLSKKGKENKI